MFIYQLIYPPLTSQHSLKSCTSERVASQNVMQDYRHLPITASDKLGPAFRRVIRAAAQNCPCFKWQNAPVISALSRPDQLFTRKAL